MPLGACWRRATAASFENTGMICVSWRHRGSDMKIIVEATGQSLRRVEMSYMEGFELSTVINRPIEDVFGALANLENDKKWRSEWVETRNTSGGAFGVGATFCLTGEFLGRRVPTIYEIIEYEPNLGAAWKTVSGPLPLRFQRTFERVEGGTRFTIRYELEVRGFFKLVMPLLAGTVKRQHAGELRKVKELMETRAM